MRRRYGVKALGRCRIPRSSVPTAILGVQLVAESNCWWNSAPPCTSRLRVKSQNSSTPQRLNAATPTEVMQ